MSYRSGAARNLPNNQGDHVSVQRALLCGPGLLASEATREIVRVHATQESPNARLNIGQAPGAQLGLSSVSYRAHRLHYSEHIGNTFRHLRGTQMPWQECSKVDERMRFVARLLEGEKMAVLCREFDISRKTGYKIFSRYKDSGLRG